MADIFIRALPKYAPDLIVLLGLYLLLLGRWKKQGRRRVLVYTVFSVYMLGVLWVTVLPVLPCWEYTMPTRPWYWSRSGICGWDTATQSGRSF